MVVSFSLCTVCDTNVSCHFFAVFVKMKDSRCAEEFVSASPVLTGCIRTLDVFGSFGQRMSAIFSGRLRVWMGGGGGGVWNSLISKHLAHYTLSLKTLLIL